VHRLLLFVFLFLASLKGVSMAAYTTEQLFSTSTEEAEGFATKAVDFGSPEFAFTTLVNEQMELWIGESSENEDEPLVRVYSPEQRDEFMIEVYRVKFAAFAEAITAGHGFLAKKGYNRIVRDIDKSNNAFAMLAGGLADESGNYTRLGRLAVISRGAEALFVYAHMDYDDYPKYEPTVSRFLGALRMKEDGALQNAFEVVKAENGSEFFAAKGWSVKKNDKPERQGASDYSMTLPDQEYPNIQIQIRPDNLETGRKLGAEMIAALTKEIEGSSKAHFVGEPELTTMKTESGESYAYTYSRGWDINETGVPMVSEFQIQKNKNGTIAICGYNTYDSRRKVGEFDEEAGNLLFKNWVVGVSAYAAAQMSLLHGKDDFLRGLDIRAVGH
jgi:hypothetical protein